MLPAMRIPVVLAALAFLGLASCAAPSARAPAQGSFANPVLDSDFPDPTVIRNPDGFYYAYATQTERNGRWINLQVARSQDLVRWEYLGDALPTKPSWASKTQDFWAPHVFAMAAAISCIIQRSPTRLTNDTDCVSLSQRLPRRPDRSWTWVARSNAERASPTSTRWSSKILRLESGCFTGDQVSSRSGSRSLAQTWCLSHRAAPLRTWSGQTRVKGAFPVLVEGAWIVSHGGLLLPLLLGR